MSYPRTEQFINRQQEIEQVEQTLDQLRKLKPPAMRGIVYYGLPGIGKSRILKYVKTRCGEKAFFPTWVDFQNLRVRSPFSYLLFLADQFDPGQTRSRFRDTILNATDAIADPSKRVEQALSVFARGVKQRLKRQPLALLMDNCELCVPDFFDWIGQRVLVQLMEIRVGPIALFIASRGPQQVAASNWPLEMIRQTLIECVPPFDFETTKQHIAAIDITPPRCRGGEKEIYALSAGHPFSTEAVVYFLQRLNVDVSDFPKHRKTLALRLHYEVIHHYLCTGVKTWNPAIFDIACIPRRFDPSLLEKISTEHAYHRYAAGWRDMQKPEVNLIEVDSGKPGYRLDKTLRRLLHTAVSILFPARARKLNRQLKQFYEKELAREASHERPTAAALLELLYHHIQIEILSNRSPLASTENLLEQKLQAHFIPEQRDDERELVHLRDLLNQDLELYEILGRAGIERLVQMIEQFSRTPLQGQPLVRLAIRHNPPAEYHVSCYSGNPAVVPTQTINTQVKHPIQQWRDKPEAIGKVAYRVYLSDHAQEFLGSTGNHAVLLTTDTMDIPFELLHDGENFLCLRRPFSRQIEALTNPRKFAAGKLGVYRALVIGNPTGDLRQSAREAQAIADLLTGFKIRVDCLIGPEKANLNKVVELLIQNAYHFIHFAGHGAFNKRHPILSGLQLAQGKKLMADELKRYLKAPAFIFFNACWAAAAGKETTRLNAQGKFIQNLAIAALEGGACGCLGPMWKIEDRDAKGFALAFYDHFLRGSSIGEAVRQARKKVFRRKTDCWASWALFGDPHVNPFQARGS
ncbi:MAG: CHAT domain-containing protein [bacterium]